MTPQELAEVVDLINTGVFPEGKIVEYRPILDAANARSNWAYRKAREECADIAKSHEQCGEFSHGSRYAGCADEIAAAIRATIKEPRT